MLPDPLGLGPHVPLPEYVENMRKIATHVKSLSEKTRLIFLTAPPVNEEQMQKAFRCMLMIDELCFVSFPFIFQTSKAFLLISENRPKPVA